MSTRRTRAEWREILVRLSESGLSVRDFARREGLCYESLSWWRWKLGSSRADPAPLESEAPQFLQLELTHSHSAAFDSIFEISLPGEITVRVSSGFDSVELQRLIQAVRSAC